MEEGVFLDARRLDQTGLETDVCIVGAGAAGITIARELANAPLSVLLLESGGTSSTQRRNRWRKART